ncbi:type II CAAX endopeptidase family protein [Nodosilinea sp. P-1105]|uniref:CPBP family intramembrane glutamic endopeptidase n=1 Tax=Nodosilinea sp. P-1105 TaxID=2546229 RepID=UPI00146E929D|nr:type II CAAX endopeptidase family protein [Nodosilinea sp. P-1105]NMF84018.1 CPBP family intramembrane metalloprotease [Nodosilinea sp. P-1105]
MAIAASKLAKSSSPVRVFAFLGLVATVWAPAALPLYWLSAQGRLPGGDLFPTALLYLVFLIVLPRWQRRVHGVVQPWRQIGFAGLKPLLRGMGLGGIIGVLSLALLVLVQLGLGWARLRPDLGWGLVGIGLAGAITAFAVGWSEEILFRGWLLWELEQGCSLRWALAISSLIFALAHFIKPLDVLLAMLPQFVGLLLLGIVLVWARRIPLDSAATTGLGHPVGLHSGLVWGYYLVNVGHLITPTGAVPAWVTGLDDNPLAGLLGLALLSLLGGIFFRWSQPPQ